MTRTQGQGNKDCIDWTTPRTGTQGQGNNDCNDWTTPRTGKKDCNDWNSRTGQQGL